MSIIKEICEEKDKDFNYRSGIKLDENYGFDSLLIIELITEIEDKYGFEFDFDNYDIEDIYDLDVLIKYVEDYTK